MGPSGLMREWLLAPGGVSGIKLKVFTHWLSQPRRG